MVLFYLDFHYVSCIHCPTLKYYKRCMGKLNYNNFVLTPFPPQTSNRLRFPCTATGCSVSTCLYKKGYVWLYSTFIRQRLDQWQRFPSLGLILNLPELRFASQLLLEPPVIPATKQNNTDKKLHFNTDRVFVQCNKTENTKFSILIKNILSSSA